MFSQTITKQRKYQKEMNGKQGGKSKIEFEGSNFKDRMYIKLAGNRRLLRKAAKAQKWPEMANYEEDSESASEFEPGQKRKRVVHDEGMEKFWRCMRKLDQTEKPQKGVVMLMENLSPSNSTIGLIQEFDPILVQKTRILLE